MSKLTHYSTRGVAESGGSGSGEKSGGDLSVPIALVSMAVATLLAYAFRPRRYCFDDNSSNTRNCKDHCGEDLSLSPQRRIQPGLVPVSPEDSTVDLQGSSNISQNDLKRDKRIELQCSPSTSRRRTVNVGLVSCDLKPRSPKELFQEEGELDGLSIAENSLGEKEIFILPTVERSSSVRSLISAGTVTSTSSASVTARRERARQKEERVRMLLHRAHSKSKLLLQQQEIKVII